MAKNLQVQVRSQLFRQLADRGLLRVIEVALSRTVTREDPTMRSATVAILMTLVDHDPSSVRGYSLKQHAAGKRPLVVFLIELFHAEEDLGLKAQMAEALRVLVDAGGEGGPLEVREGFSYTLTDTTDLRLLFDEGSTETETGGPRGGKVLTILLRPLYSLTFVPYYGPTFR